MSTEPAVVVRRLTKVFPVSGQNRTLHAVDDVSFRVGRGEIFGFLGPNGAGKTTTIRMLLGLMEPTTGAATVLGHRLPEEAKAVHARAGYMSQHFTLYPDLSAVENIRFYGRTYGIANRILDRREEELIAMAGLSGREHELTGTLSGGWRQRLALGCAIIHEPELVFLDEPTAGVDPKSRRELWELIYGLAREGTTVLVTTHHMDEAELCQRVAFINKGRLAACGTPEELKAQWTGGQVLEIDCDRPEAAVKILSAAERDDPRLRTSDLALYGAQIHAVVTDAEAARAPIRSVLTEAGIAVRTISSVSPSLEDVFVFVSQGLTGSESG